MTTKASHTPGPWTIREGEDPISLWGEHPEHGGITVCRVPAPRTNASALADARLIAEAPAMLEWIKSAKVILAMSKDNFAGSFERQITEEIESARAILARIEGEHGNDR